MTYHVCEDVAWKYANTYIDRQVGEPIIVLGPRDMIG